jgi:hypothetical protein
VDDGRPAVILILGRDGRLWRRPVRPSKISDGTVENTVVMSTIGRRIPTFQTLRSTPGRNLRYPATPMMANISGAANLSGSAIIQGTAPSAMNEDPGRTVGFCRSLLCGILVCKQLVL